MHSVVDHVLLSTDVDASQWEVELGPISPSFTENNVADLGGGKWNMHSTLVHAAMYYCRMWMHNERCGT